MNSCNFGTLLLELYLRRQKVRAHKSLKEFYKDSSRHINQLLLIQCITLLKHKLNSFVQNVVALYPYFQVYKNI